MTQAVLRQAEAVAFPTLPGTYRRGDVERVLRTVSPALGLSAALFHALLGMIQTTRPSDWTNPDCDAICFKPQIEMARELGISARTLRGHEAALERMGLIRKTVGADGSRGRFGKGKIAQGISFSPLIIRFAGLLNLLERVQSDNQRAQILRRKCSAAKRELTRRLSTLLEQAPKHPSLQGQLRFHASLPRRYEGLAVGELEMLFADVDNRVRDIGIDLDLLRNSAAMAAESFRPYIQDTNQEDSEACSASDANERTACKQAEAQSPTPAPHGSGDCFEKSERLADRGHKPEFTETFSPEQLYWMASDDMRMYLDARSHADRPLTQHDFIQAAMDILPARGVHPSAWTEASEVMGDIAAALCVLVIDANMFRVARPVQKPGAMLRAMTRLAARGALNLHGSLIGLKAWKLRHDCQ